MGSEVTPSSGSAGSLMHSSVLLGSVFVTFKNITHLMYIDLEPEIHSWDKDSTPVPVREKHWCIWREHYTWEDNPLPYSTRHTHTSTHTRHKCTNVHTYTLVCQTLWCCGRPVLSTSLNLHMGVNNSLEETIDPISPPPHTHTHRHTGTRRKGKRWNNIMVGWKGERWRWEERRKWWTRWKEGQRGGLESY